MEVTEKIERRGRIKRNEKQGKRRKGSGTVTNMVEEDSVFEVLVCRFAAAVCLPAVNVTMLLMRGGRSEGVIAEMVVGSIAVPQDNGDV